jgi:ribosomal protein S5
MLLEHVYFIRSVSRLHVEAGSSTSTAALRVVGGNEKGTQGLGDNWTTFFLGDVETGTLPSRMGESQI